MSRYQLHKYRIIIIIISIIKQNAEIVVWTKFIFYARYVFVAVIGFCANAL